MSNRSVSSGQLRQRSTFLFVSAYVVAGVALPLLYLGQPLHFDEAIFLVVAEQVVQGKSLYVEAIDHKPPGIYAVAAVATELTAHPHRALRLLTYGVTAASGLLVFHLGRTVRDRTTGMIAAVLFLLISYMPHFDGFFSLTEPWAVLAMVTAAALLFDDWPVSDAAAGVALGIGVLFNQTVFLFGAVIVAFHVRKLTSPPHRTRSYLYWTLRRVVVIGLGFLLPVSIVVAVFHAGNLLEPMLHYTMIVPLTTYSTPFELQGHLLAAATLLPVWILAGVGVSGIALEVARGRSVSDEHLFTAIWAVVLFIPGAMSFAGDHKFLMAFPAIALMASIGLTAVYDWVAEAPFSTLAPVKTRPSRLTVVAIVVFASLVPAVGANVIYAQSLLEEDRTTEVATATRIADRVDGAVYTYPPQNQLYYATDLAPVTRWLGPPYSGGLVEMSIADLEREDVRYVVVPRAYISDGRISYDGYWAETQEPLVTYLNRNYELVDDIGEYVILGRSDPSADTGSA